MQDIEVRHLRLVQAIVEEGGMTQAGLRLHLSQSALSVQLKDLEERLGVPLFERRGRKMVALSAGTRVLHVARRVLPELEATEREVREMNGPERCQARISTECFTCYRWFVAAMRELMPKYPSLDPEIAVEETRNPLPALLAGRLDLAVVSSPVKQRQIRLYPMLRDELVLLTPPRHPLSARRFVTAKDFVDVHLLTYDVPPDHLDLFCRVLRPARVHPRKVQRVPLTEAILEMVKAGIGVAVHPRWIAAPDLEAGRLRAVRITRGGMKRTWSLAARWPGPPLLHAFARDLAGYGCRGMDCGASK